MSNATNNADMLIRIGADLAPLLGHLTAAERMVRSAGGRMGDAADNVQSVLNKLTGAGNALRGTWADAMSRLDGAAAARKAIGADVWDSLSREAERDYAAFWSRVMDEQTRSQGQMAARSQQAIAALTGQRYLGPVAREVRSDYESLWSDLLSQRDAAQAEIIRHNEDTRAGFDPLFASQLTYRRRLEEIDDALARNVISEDVAAKARQTAIITHQQQTKALDRSSLSFGRMALAAGVAFAALGGVAALTAVGREAVLTAARFDSLEGSLTTVTRSALAAQGVFEKIQEFAGKTPFSVEESTRAFITLKARGLDPSMEALRDYGNTASSMSYRIGEMVEAVAGATTGEFDSLKKFGIDAQTMGDKVIFTFRGTSTEVGKSAAQIEAYLRRLGQVEFAGAMEEQSKRIGGALSNMGDSWDRLLSRIGKSLPVQMVATGFGAIFDGITDAMDTTLSERIEDLRDDIDSYERDMQALMSNIQDNFQRGTPLEALEADMAEVARLRGLIAAMSGDLTKLRQQQAERTKAAEDAMKPGKQGETPEQKQQRRLQEQYDALKSGGMLAWQGVVDKQREADGGMAAIQGRLDKLKEQLSRADGLRTPWEAWPKELAELKRLLDAGLISLTAFQAAAKAANPVTALQADIATLEPDTSKFDREWPQLLGEFQVQVTADFEASLEAPKGALMDLAKTADITIGFVSDETKALAKSAADGLGNVILRMQSGDWGSVVEGIGDFYEKLGEVEKATGSGASALMTMAKAAWNSAEAGAAAGQILNSMLGRSKEQQKNANKGAAVGATIAQITGLPKGPLTAIGSLLGGSFGMSKADERAIKRAKEIMDLVGQVNSFLVDAAPKTATASALDDLESRFATLRAEAQRLGQPVEALTRAYEAQRAAIRRQVANDNQARLFRSTGQDWRADLSVLLEAHKDAINDSLLAEAPLAEARRANAAELAAFVERLTYDQALMLGDLISQLDLARARVRSLFGDALAPIDDMIANGREAAAAIRAESQAFRQTAKNLRQQVQDNRTGDLSPLALVDRLAAAQSAFEALYAKARTGDRAAMDQLSGAGQTLLDLGRDYYASSADYAALFETVQDKLTQASAIGDVRAGIMEGMATGIDLTVTILEDLKETLESNLGQPTASAIAGAIADNVLTVGEIQGINNALTSLSNRFANVTGEEGQAVRTAIDTLRGQLVEGQLNEAQKNALTSGQQAVSVALENFRTTQIEAYQAALVSAGNALSAMQNFLLDPQGRIPAAVEAAFGQVNFAGAVVGSIQAMVAGVLGVMVPGQTYVAAATALNPNLVGTVQTGATYAAAATGINPDLVGVVAPGQTYVAAASAVNASLIGTVAAGNSLAALSLPLVNQMVGAFTGATLASQLSGVTDDMIGDATGTYTGRIIAVEIAGVMDEAIASWGTADDPRTLATRINAMFGDAVGATDGESWAGALNRMLGDQAPLVQRLQDLLDALPNLIAAMTQDDGAAQAAYDSAMQAWVTPIKNAIAAADQTIRTTKVDERSGSHNNWTSVAVDVASGSSSRIAGNKDSEASRSRAAQLGQGLAGLVRQIEALTGGKLSGGLSVLAGEENSGYKVGSLDRLTNFAGNDFAGIARAFVGDVLSNLEGANAQALDILRGSDFTNMVQAFTNAASAIYQATNARPSVTAPAANSPAIGSSWNDLAYLAANPDVAAAVAAGQFRSGQEHWQQYGQYEGNRIRGFANGGDFGGGLRLVGEGGPEIEVTGPSRIFSAPRTTQMLRDALRPAPPPPAPANDGRMVDAINRLSGQVERLTSVTIAMQGQVGGQQGELLSAIRTQVNTVNRLMAGGAR